MSDAVQPEVETFEAQRSALAKSHSGSFVLVHGEEIVDFFPTRAAALREGYRRYGRASFLVKKVEAHEEPARFASTLIQPPGAR